MYKIIIAFLLLPTLALAQVNWDHVKPIKLSAPAWNSKVEPIVSGPNPPPLREVSVTPNQITDEANWYATNQLVSCFWSMPWHLKSDLPMVPEHFPLRYNEELMTRAWHVKGIAYFVYSDSLLFVADSLTTKLICAYNLNNYMYSPSDRAEDKAFVKQDIHFALLFDSVLYISNYHSTYAKSSGNKNGYITALNTSTNTVRWRSAALVNNSSTFVMKSGFIYCGYGFTAEPDFIYLLNSTTGKAIRSFPVKSGPETIILKQNSLYVRTYNTDYIFDVTVRKH